MIARSLLLLGALALPAAAQTSQPTKPTKSGGDESAARQRAAVLVQKLTFDEKLLGTTRLGFYRNTKNHGTMTITVAKAPAASGAAYRVKIKAAIGFRKMKSSLSGSVLLGPGLELVQADSKQSAATGTTQTKRVAKKDGRWRYSATYEEGGQRKTGELTAAAGANHWETASQILFSRVLGRRPPGRYVLRGLEWPSLGGSGWVGGESAKWVSLTFVVGKPAARTIRGTARQIIPVKVIRGGLVRTQTFLVDASGAFYGLEIDQSPMRLVAGTEAQVTADLKPTGEGPAIRNVVRVWFEVTCGKKQPEALDPVTDWAAVAAARKKADASLKGKTAMEIAAVVKKQLLANPLPEKALRDVGEFMRVQVRGDKARVWLDISKSPVPEWKLVKSGKTWKLVDLPTKIGRH